MVLKNGTPGKTDGEEITSLTIKNILNSYALEGDSSTVTSRNGVVIPISLRTKPGYIASSITIQANSSPNVYKGGILTNPTDIREYSSLPTKNEGWFQVEDSGALSTVVNSTSNLTFLFYIFMVGSVSSLPTNTPLFKISYQEDKV
jgi:hypothetical protein